jgi:hypothetical protein
MAMMQPRATLVWYQFGRPQPDDKSSKQASFGLNSAGLSPAMNAAAATLFWSQFEQPQSDDECSSGHPLLVSIRPASAQR